MEESPSLAGPPPPPLPPQPDPLQFDKVEYAETPSSMASCVACAQPITDIYYEANGKIVCPRCKEQLKGSIHGGSRLARFGRAFLFGLGAAILSAAAYYLICKITNSELAIATIAMGWLIGKAVHTGANSRGGWFYIITAVTLTYLSIGASVLALALAEEGLQGIGIEQWIFLLIYMFAVPVLAAISSPLLFLIYGFGLWQAGRMNVRPHIAVTGPYYTRGGTAVSPNDGTIPDDKLI